jgi:NlpC/P60 family putative phage cell wall peptidase
MDTDTRRRLLDTGEWRQYVIDEARKWKGTPYQHKARVKGVGCDCGGIIYEIYNPLLGPFAPFPTDYAQDWAMHNEDTRYMDFIMPYVKEVPKAVPGGLAMFRVGRSFGHAAICSEKKTFIHAWGRTQHGSVIESKIQFFSWGGKPRPVKYYDVSEKCL